MSGQSETRSTPERRILGELGNSNPDSPTANLRLLTTLASSLKSAPNSPCKSCSGSGTSGVQLPVKAVQQLQQPQQQQQVQQQRQQQQQQQESSCAKLLPRKEKSLSLLCNKFLNLFPLTVQENVRKEISLNTTAQALGTEKRRIYDIINVLESLQMASKAGKNLYYWHGQSRLPMTLAELKMSAIELGLEQKIQDIQKINRAYIENSCHTCGSPSSNLMVPQSPVVNYSFPDSSDKEDKSLGVMCRKFVMLFLVSLKNGVINLDIAAKVLINEQDSSDSKSSTSQNRYKTKVRRLYDIANVLSAIGLIEKVDLYNCVIRKPIFKYTGPSVDCINYDSESQPLIGMTTPSKKNSETSNFRTLSRLTRLYSSTPGNKREAKKRKLFDSEDKFQRTRSSPCLSTTQADDSFFRVVEMEYKRLKSSEHKPKVCTTLFPRHRSDSCFSPTEIEDSPVKSKTSVVTSNEILNDRSNFTMNTPVTLPVVSKENLVKESCNVDIPVSTVRINVPLELKITPFTVPQQKTPKFVKLSKLDIKKLVPISNDMKIKLAPIKVATQNPSNSMQKPNVAVLTQIPTQDISPGEIYPCKAVKVGNTLHFVPIKSKNASDQKK